MKTFCLLEKIFLITLIVGAFSTSHALIIQRKGNDKIVLYNAQGLSAEFKFIQVEPLNSKIGSPMSERGHQHNELNDDLPVDGFEIQETLVTQMMAFLVLNKNPSKFSKLENCPPGDDPNEYKEYSFDPKNPKNLVSMCKDYPVESVSWQDIMRDFLPAMNRADPYHRYSLPREEQFEAAARARTHSAFFCGNDSECLDPYAWYAKNSGFNRPHPVKTRLPNQFGLYDMSGNVFEITASIYDENYIESLRRTIAYGNGQFEVMPNYLMVIRGGAYWGSALDLRSAARNPIRADERRDDAGFRLVRTKVVR